MIIGTEDGRPKLRQKLVLFATKLAFFTVKPSQRLQKINE